MNAKEIKIGDYVYVVFRKYKKYYLYGRIEEICLNKHALRGWWVSIMPIKSDTDEPYVDYLIKNRIGLLIPLIDVIKIAKEGT